eukprot:TRINITY_DN20192_c0_g1_i2.p1 TRINITY_DN20192_c0_g1~~TRINITY_DN20192_c0_g1_i2.p1  ORF type:complete len:408 (-),score=81.85 TRINITY_DN20192_c0_g1_i2:52-1275(-)
MPQVQRAIVDVLSCCQEQSRQGLRFRQPKSGKASQKIKSSNVPAWLQLACDQPASASFNACGAALQGAILGDRPADGAKLQSLMLIDTISHSLGIEAEGGVLVGVIPPHTPIPTTKEVNLKLVNSGDRQARIHLREVSGSSSAWLGAVTSDLNQHEDRNSDGAEAERDTEETFTVKIEVHVHGYVQMEVGNELSRPLGDGRAGALSSQELSFLSAELTEHAAGSWVHYGQRRELPPRLSCVDPRRSDGECGAVEQVPSADAETEESEEDDEDEDDGTQEEVRSSAGHGVLRGDSRGQAYAQRLRQKVQQRRQTSQSEVPTMSQAESGSLPLSTTEVCAVCLCTEAELGRPFCWVLEKCGHRCICKACLRKLRARQKRVQVECPMCRVRSKPVLEERYEGEIFTAEAD